MTDPSDWVLAAPFRCHARWLCEATGIDARTLAVLVGVPTLTLLRLVEPRRPRHSPDRLRHQDAQRLFSFGPDELRERAHRRVAATRSAELAGRLLEMVPAQDAAALSGLPPAELVALANHRRTSCPRLHEARLQAALLQVRARSAQSGPRVGGMELERAA